MVVLLNLLNSNTGTRMPVFFNHVPAGTSLPNFVHYGQGLRSEQMILLDYMSEEQNTECYASAKPPRVPLENIIESDMYLVNALNDLLGDPKDVAKLKASFRVPFHSKTVELKEFSHIGNLVFQFFCFSKILTSSLLLSRF